MSNNYMIYSTRNLHESVQREGRLRIARVARDLVEFDELKFKVNVIFYKTQRNINVE